MNKLNESDVFTLLQSGKHICRLCFSSLKKEVKCYSIFESNIHQTLQQYCSCNEVKNVISKFIEQKEILGKAEESSLDCDNEIEYIDNSEDIGSSCVKEISSTNDINTKKLNKNLNYKYKTQQGKAVKRIIRKAIKTNRCCGQEFKTNTEYYGHIRSHGVVRKNYECSECDKKYVSYFELEVHLRKHSGERPFHCSLCEKSFIDKRNLRKHEKIHTGNKKHECLVCHKKFLHLFTLKTHERIHTGEKPFVCENCGKSFNTSTELKIHRRTHTKEKPYECSSCKKAFCSKAALNTHILVHTGEKKFGCTICSRKCRTSFDLKTHMRCHSNEKPYTCKYSNCDKKYRNSSQLNVHLRTHKGEKPHQCAVCFKQFGESNTLKRHIGIHEKNTESIT